MRSTEFIEADKIFYIPWDGSTHPYTLFCSILIQLENRNLDVYQLSYVFALICVI